MIKADKVNKNNLRFDPKYGLTGGEDSVFFDLLSKYQAKYVVCREAISYEVVPQYRTELKFICSRYFQKGNNEGRIINDKVHSKFQNNNINKTIVRNRILWITVFYPLTY